MRAALPLGLVLGVVACGPPEVEGSLGEVVDLRYRSVRVTSTAEEVAVSFIAPQGSGENLILKVSARLAGMTLTPRAPVDLAEEAPDGGQRGAVSRDVLDDPRNRFPPLERGRLVLNALPSPGQKVGGELSVTFVNGTGFANGRTAFKTFEAQVP